MSWVQNMVLWFVFGAVLGLLGVTAGWIVASIIGLSIAIILSIGLYALTEWGVDNMGWLGLIIFLMTVASFVISILN